MGDVQVKGLKKVLLQEEIVTEEELKSYFRLQEILFEIDDGQFEINMAGINTSIQERLTEFQKEIGWDILRRIQKE